MAVKNTTTGTENRFANAAPHARADASTATDAVVPGTGTGAGHDGPSGAVWAALVANPGGTAAVIAAAAGVSKTAARRALTALETGGHAARTPGTGKGRARTPDTWHPATPEAPAASATTSTGESGPNTPATPDAPSADQASPPGEPDDQTAAGENTVPPAEPGETAPEITEDDAMDTEFVTAAREALAGLGEAITAALTALDGADRDAAQAAGEAIYTDSGKVRRLLRTAAAGARSRTASGRAKSAPGELRGKVAAHLAAYPGLEFTPHEIGKAIGHSAGAVANALDRLVGLGEAIETCERPRRFTGTTPTPAAEEPDEANTGEATASAPLAATA